MTIAPSTRSSGPVFFLLAVGAGVISMMQSLLSPVLPLLRAELNTSQSAVSWVLIAFLLTAAVATPILGRIGDEIGKVRTLLIALGAMIVGIAIDAVAPSIEILVLGRAIQGIGMAAFPLSYGILRDKLPTARVPSAVGTLASVIAVGGGVGVVLAGPIVALLGWRWLFVIPLLLLIVVAAAVARSIPETTVFRRPRINWVAGALLAGWLTALLLPLSQGTQWGWTHPGLLASFALAAVLMVAWIMVETRSSNPLIDMAMLRQPAVWKTNLVALLFGAAMFSVWAFLPQFAQMPVESGYGFGMSVTEAGWLIFPMLVTMALAGMVSGRLAPIVSFRTQITLGSALVAVASLGMAFFHATVWELVISSTVFGTGLGFAYSTMTNIIVASVKPTQTGAASGMNANIRTIGGAIGTAVMTAVVTAHRLPDGFPTEDGFTVGFALFGVVSALAIIVCLLLPRIGTKPALAPRLVPAE